MNRLALACALAVALSAGARPQGGQTPPVHHLVRVEVRDARALARLIRLDLDFASCAPAELLGKRVEVIATDGDIETLEGSGFSFHVAIRNLEEHYRRVLAEYGAAPEQLTPPVGQGAMGGHYTLAQMEATLDSFGTDFPTICSAKVSIGQSVEGRDIWMVKISDNVGQDEAEPSAFFDAVHHAREPMSMAATLLFMNRLLEGYGSDPDLTYLVDHRELYFVPCVNPDGYVYNETTNPGGGGLWRKNRRNNGDGTFGVDLNRNYTTGWDAPNGGNSTSTDSNTYRGTAPFSEPETQAIEAFVSSHDFAVVSSTHCYTEILLRPWGLQAGDPANAAEYVQIGEALTASNPMPHGPASTLLYIAAGTAMDHHHAAHGSSSWTPELGLGSEGGFWPAPPAQVEIADRHQPMFDMMALVAGSALGLGEVTVAEGAGSNGNGVVEPGEAGEVVATVLNNGLLDSAGSVTVEVTALSPGLVVTGGQQTLPAIGRVSAAGTSPFTFAVPSGYQPLDARLRVTVTGDGRTVTTDVRFLVVELRPVVGDDFEADRGFERATSDTATTGLWERGAPEATSFQGREFQPGSQHTVGGQSCWVTDWRAGGAVGDNDVDDGITDLLSPVVDLSHLRFAELRTWRWFAESQDNDDFEVAVSDDGGQSWTTLYANARDSAGWEPLDVELPLPLTDRMRFRIRAQDANASLVEAAIDDFAIHGLADDASITLLASGAIGTEARFGAVGAANAQGVLFASPFLAAPTAVPGVGGSLLLDIGALIPLPPLTFDSAGTATFDLPIPNQAGLRGGTLHFQLLHFDGSAVRLGNAQTLVVR